MSCQQYELYAAEGGVPKGRTFGSIEEIQKYVDDLRERPWWILEYGKVLKVEVAKSRAKGSVGGFYPEKNAGRIEMAECHWNELYVLHELAHVLAKARHQSQAHCPYFARVYLEMVSREMGPETYTKLYEAFENHNIEHDPNDKRGHARFYV